MERTLEESIKRFYKTLERIYTFLIPERPDERLLECTALIEAISCIITLMDSSAEMVKKGNKPKAISLVERHSLEELLPGIIIKTIILNMDNIYHYNKKDDFYTLKSLIKIFVPEKNQIEVLEIYSTYQKKWENSPFKEIRNFHIAHNKKEHSKYYTAGVNSINQEDILIIGELIFQAMEIVVMCFSYVKK